MIIAFLLKYPNIIFLCAFIAFSFEDRNEVILEMESAKARTLDVRDDTSQESQISELPHSKNRRKERQSEETIETKVFFIFHVGLTS